MEINAIRLEILDYLAEVGEEVQDNEMAEYVKETLPAQYSDEEFWDSLGYLEEKGLIVASSKGLQAKGYVITIDGKRIVRKMKTK